MPPRKPVSGPPACSISHPARWLLWVGTTAEAELSLAHTWLREGLSVVVAENPRQACEMVGQGAAARDGLRAGRDSPPLVHRWEKREEVREDFFQRPPAAGDPWNAAPALILLASDRPGRWSLDDVILLTSRWPLVPVVSVGASLCDGRRRSGPALPGVEEISWHDLAGRIGRWFADLDTGRPGGLGLPTTARREERLLESTLLAPGRTPPPESPPVALAARRLLDLEGLADLLSLAGRRIERRSQGRPPLEAAGATVIWDAGRLDREDLAWLQLLSSNQPSLPILVLESFPRGDSTLAALRAGAGAIVGRPLSLEALMGTLVCLENAPASGLGPAGMHR